MKKIFLLALVVSSLSVFGQSSVTAVVTNYGVAPVPAFTLGKPALFMVFDGYLLKRKTFSVEVAPDLAINIKNGQGWFGDTWVVLNKSFDTANHWVASAGFNWSMIFVPMPNGTTKSVPYPTERLRLQYIPNAKNTFDAETWHTAAVPLRDGIKGTYISFQYTRTQQIRSFGISGTLNLFHLSYSDGTEGFANAISASVFHKSGIFIGCQIMNNFNATNVKANSNFSIGIKRKI